MENNIKEYEISAAKRAWEELCITYQAFSDRMKMYDDMNEKQGNDISVYQVYTEIQNIRSQLDRIQDKLILDSTPNCLLDYI